MSFTIRYECGGRLGNCAFPYALCVLYQILYGYKYVTEKQPNEVCITDDIFIRHSTEENIKNGILINVPSNIVINGYFQHDVVFKYFLYKIYEFITLNPNQVIHTGSNQSFLSNVLIKDVLPSLNVSPTTVVIHLRMEDNIVDKIEKNSPKFIIHPDDYELILKNIKYDKIIWIMNEPKHDIEKKYISYLQKKYGGEYKPQTLEEDMTIMRKAHILVCSRSTLSWISSVFSYNQQKVFMPEKYEDWPHETFKSIHPDTTYYSYRKATKKDLEYVCNNT